MIPTPTAYPSGSGYGRRFAALRLASFQNSAVKSSYIIYSKISSSGNGYKYPMRYHDITEGRALKLPVQYSADKQEILVIENPTVGQASTLIVRATQPDGSFYLRGIMVGEKRLLVWDGWLVTHDAVREVLLPKLEEHSSDYLRFEYTEFGAEVLRQSDYDLMKNRYYQNIVKAAEMN